MNMYGNYEERLVENTKINGAVIDTVMVTDSYEPYETGIAHPNFNDGKWIIVEMYNSKEQARAGHKKWVNMFRYSLPKELKDVSTSTIKKLTY